MVTSDDDLLLTRTEREWKELLEARDLESFEEQLRFGETGALAGLNPDAVRAVQLMQQVFRGDEASAPPTPPVNVGRFQVVSVLGTGRFGVVWLAFDPDSNREVAVKVLHSGLVFDEAQRRRFQRECQLAARLDHHGIVPVYEVGSIGETLYLVMPVCRGLTLDRWLQAQSERVPTAAAAYIALRLAEAVHFGHVHGVVHRDLKPSNVMVSQELGVDIQPSVDFEASSNRRNLANELRILDFGLAIPMEVSLRDTRGSMVAGTPLYMAPEQAMCRMDEIGPATDVFAIGAILYELLTGEPPFNAATLPDVLERLENGSPASIRRQRSDVTRDLEAVCMKCLARDPRDRYQTALQLAEDLGRFLRDRPVSARSPSRLHRLIRWAGQRRGREALSQWCVATNVLMLAWSIAALPISLWQVRGDPEVADTVLPIVVPLFTGIVPLHLLLIWLSRQVTRRSGAWLFSIVGLMLSSVTLAYAIAVLCGALPPAPAYTLNPFARAVSFTLVSVSSTFLAMAFLLATLASWPRNTINNTSGV